jgi:hypothetical protein
MTSRYDSAAHLIPITATSNGTFIAYHWKWDDRTIFAGIIDAIFLVMPRERTALPPEIKELIQLIRQGRLFEVQDWIAAGKSIRLPREGSFSTSPTLAAVRAGNHSMVQVLLGELSQEEDLQRLLWEAPTLV